MHDPVLFAVPFFLLLLVIEWTAARKLAAHRGPERAPVRGLPAAATRGRASAMGLVSIGTTGALELPRAARLRRDLRLRRAVAPAVDRLVHVGDRHPRRRPAVTTAYHRMAHRVRLVWATHQAHHSSQYFNFATALRQKWNNSGDDPPAGAAATARRSAVDGVRQLLHQPDLPVLDPHRAHRQAVAAHRVRLQHAVAPPRAPRHGRSSTSTRTTAAS